jgi:hypothetical protein
MTIKIDPELKNIMKKRKKGIISKMYMEGLISEKAMIIFSQAVELFKEEFNQTLDDFYKLPIRCKSMYENRHYNKEYFIELSTKLYEEKK